MSDNNSKEEKKSENKAQPLKSTARSNPKITFKYGYVPTFKARPVVKVVANTNFSSLAQTGTLLVCENLIEECFLKAMDSYITDQFVKENLTRLTILRTSQAMI
jgi:hypothetical protein